MGEDRYKAWSNPNTIEAASQMILGQHTAEPLNEDHFILDFMGFRHRGTVLDFGCGVGRNTFMLASRCREVIAYDFPNMLSLLRQDYRFLNFVNIHPVSSWSLVKRSRKLDAIVCCISLQHIHIDDLKSIVKDFSYLTDNLYVHGRATLDFTGDLIYPIISEHWDVKRIYGDSNPSSEKLLKMTGNDHYFAHYIPKPVEEDEQEY